jgi:hypothetical protein
MLGVRPLLASSEAFLSRRISTVGEQGSWLQYLRHFPQLFEVKCLGELARTGVSSLLSASAFKDYLAGA